MYVTSCINIILFFTDWFENINILYNKIDIYVKHNFDAESFYVEKRSENCVKHVTTVAHSSLNEVNCYE